MTDDAGNAAGVAGRDARELLDRYWEEFLSLEPVFATLVGDERYDDRLPDSSPDGLARRESVHRSALRDLEGMRRDGLGVEDRTAHDKVESLARRDVASSSTAWTAFGP